MNAWSIVAEHYTPVTKQTVFAQLGYEPTCMPRWLAKQRGDSPLPAPCGQCPQELFHAATEDDVLYGGAAGGGKTKALVMDAVASCMVYPGITVAVFRRTFPELRSEVQPEFRKIGYAKKLGASWNKGIWEMSFSNSSLIRCLYADSEDDAVKYHSAEWQLLILLERTLFPNGVASLLKERLRSGSPAVPVLGTRSGSNPGGPSHAEVKNRFIKPTGYGKEVIADAEGKTVRFVPAKVSDNPHIDKGYLATLEGIPDPARRAAMRDGNWDVYVGQAFSEWNHERHVVPPLRTFRLPESWQRYQGVDYGETNPFACYWGALDEDGRVWIYRELYQAGLTAPQQAEKILTAESLGLSAGIDPISKRWSDERPEPQPRRRADPSMWAKRGEYVSIARAYSKAGVKLQPANNDRLNGVATFHEYLAEAPACRLHADLGWKTCPKLHIFDNCINLIETLPDLQRDPNRPEDVLKCDTDHAYDAVRYLLMGIGGGAAFLELDDDADVDDPRFALHDDLGEIAALPEALSMPTRANGRDVDDDWDW